MSGVAGDSLRQTTREKHRDPQLLGLGVFEWELQLQSDLLLRTVFPRQGGRKGKKKSLSYCQKIFNVSQRSLPTPASLQSKLSISVDWREPSDPMPLPGPQTEMQKPQPFPWPRRTLREGRTQRVRHVENVPHSWGHRITPVSGPAPNVSREFCCVYVLAWDKHNTPNRSPMLQ